MDIKRIGRNPASSDPSRTRASQISVHNGTVYFAATPERPFDPGASITVQTQQMLKRVEERLLQAGSDKSRILMAHVMIADMRYFADMNAVWEAWVDQDSQSGRAIFCWHASIISRTLKAHSMIIKLS